MKQQPVRLRRLYRARGCRLAAGLEITHEFGIGSDFAGHFYLGPYPRFGLWRTQGDRYAVAGEVSELATTSYVGNLREAGDSSPMYCELAAIGTVDVTDELSVAADAGDAAARNAIVAMAETLRHDATRALNLAAGVIGLRFHRQFVLELLNENEVALFGSDFMSSFAGVWVEMLDEVTLSAEGLLALKAMLSRFSMVTYETREALGSLFHWLLRVWPERDPVSQFLALFIPLETALQGTETPMPKDDKRMAESIRRAIRTVSEGEERKQKLAFFNGLAGRVRPSLEQRFAKLAATAKLPGWESDIEAFERFNKARNQLLHRGNPSVKLRVEITDNVVRTLEDLVERYLSYVVFKDDWVYPSRWRPARTA